MNMNQADTTSDDEKQQQPMPPPQQSPRSSQLSTSGNVMKAPVQDNNSDANSMPTAMKQQNRLTTQQRATNSAGSNLSSSGSATGNPRNKCALKPGHSLMDWVRLGNSGCDLAGTKGIIKSVSCDELRRHNTRKDAWLAIRGKVYNVTTYMDFHPGGVDELMKGIGIDATKLFDEVHAWVNYEQLLAKCFIGPLRTSVVLNLDDDGKSRKKISSMNKLPPISTGFLGPQMMKLVQATSLTKAIALKSPFGEKVDNNDYVEIVPRFDWLQNVNDLCIIFYTKARCNPGVTIHFKSASNNCDIDILILIENNLHVCSMTLAHDVQWPGVLAKVNTDTGKIEVIFKKKHAAIWSSYGQLERRKTNDLSMCNFMYDVVKCAPITHDSYELYLKPIERVHQLFPIGYHVNLTATIDGNAVTRSYTPVPHLFTIIKSNFTHHIAFLIKSYENGILSSHIVLSPTHIKNLELSYAKGKSPLLSINQHKQIGILAAGSGITPMLSIINYLMGRSPNDLASIQLLYFNKTENDIWCRQILESLSTIDDRFQLTHILSEPPPTWSGEHGRVSKELAHKLFDSASPMYSTVCFVCGPRPFNDSCTKLLSSVGFQDENLHLFYG